MLGGILIMDFLEKIIEHKKTELEAIKRAKPLKVIEGELRSRRVRHHSLTERLLSRHPAVIAEIKRRSPSKGELRQIADAGVPARSYEDSGAAAVSVLTDTHFFNGSLDDLKEVRAAVDIPVLRKDFIIDPYQVYESALNGADAILLITSCLERPLLADLCYLAKEIGLEILCETESEDDMRKIEELPFGIIGINNRNLHTFSQGIDTGIRLVSMLPPDVVKVSESGIESEEQAVALYRAGFNGFLIGELFMRAENPGERLRKFIGNFNRLTADEDTH